MTVKLSLAREGEEPVTFDLDGPGGTCRIAVGEPGRRSAVWRMWAPRNKSDVYVSARVLVGIQKVSLHESGDWRIQWVSREHKERFAPHLPDRRIATWRRPDAPTHGWTRAVTIWVPGRDVRPVHDDAQEEEGVVWLPPADTDQVYAIHVVIAKPDRGFVEVKGGIPVDGFVLADGEVMLLVVARPTLTPEQTKWLDTERARVLQTAANVGVEPGDGIRATLWGDVGTAGGLNLWDLAYAPAGSDTE